MAYIEKYEEIHNPDGRDQGYQQTVTVVGAAVSSEVILPGALESGFSFATSGAGTPQVTMSTVADIKAGTAVWVDNDLSGGPSFAVSKIGSFRGVSGIRINNASGTSTLNIITKNS